MRAFANDKDRAPPEVANASPVKIRPPSQNEEPSGARVEEEQEEEEEEEEEEAAEEEEEEAAEEEEEEEEDVAADQPLEEEEVAADQPLEEDDSDANGKKKKEEDVVEVEVQAGTEPPSSGPATLAPGESDVVEVDVGGEGGGGADSSSARPAARDMAQAYTSKELKDMALKLGVSQAGKKVDVCQRILTARAASRGGPAA